MNNLEVLYVRLLSVGFLVLQQAVDSGDLDWIRTEVEFLHNVPSLIGEMNIKRHRYFWLGERALYLERMSAHESDWQQSRIQTFYQPIFDEMQAIWKTLPDSDDSAHRLGRT
jgi:hypothetical protein